MKLLYIMHVKIGMKLVKYLVEFGADVNIINNYGEIPLFGVCRNETKELLKYLIEQGAYINKENYYGLTLKTLGI